MTEPRSETSRLSTRDSLENFTTTHAWMRTTNAARKTSLLGQTTPAEGVGLVQLHSTRGESTRRQRVVAPAQRTSKSVRRPIFSSVTQTKEQGASEIAWTSKGAKKSGPQAASSLEIPRFLEGKLDHQNGTSSSMLSGAAGGGAARPARGGGTLRSAAGVWSTPSSDGPAPPPEPPRLERN